MKLQKGSREEHECSTSIAFIVLNVYTIKEQHKIDDSQLEFSQPCMKLSANKTVWV